MAEPTPTPPATENQAQASPSSAVEPSGAAVSQSPAAPASSPADTGSQATPQQAAEYQSIRDAIKQYDPQLAEQFQDDHGALQHLLLAYRQAQQASQLAPYGQLYLQHADAFQNYLRQQQESARRQQEEAAKGRKWFQLPEYDPQWLSMVDRDAQTGEYKVKPGAPPDLLQKLTAYGQARQQLQDKFFQDPQTTLGPLIEHIAEQKAREIVGSNLGGYRDQVFADGFVRENSTWLHARDAGGNLVRDPQSGGPALSPWGNRFRDYVVQAEQMGLRDVRAQQQYALRLVQSDFALAQLAAAGGSAAREQANQAALAAANRPNQGGVLNGGVPVQAPNQNRQSLADRLRKNFQAAGLKDTDFAAAR